MAVGGGSMSWTSAWSFRWSLVMGYFTQKYERKVLKESGLKRGVISYQGLLSFGWSLSSGYSARLLDEAVYISRVIVSQGFHCMTSCTHDVSDDSACKNAAYPVRVVVGLRGTLAEVELICDLFPTAGGPLWRQWGGRVRVSFCSFWPFTRFFPLSCSSCCCCCCCCCCLVLTSLADGSFSRHLAGSWMTST